MKASRRGEGPQANIAARTARFSAVLLAFQLGACGMALPQADDDALLVKAALRDPGDTPSLSPDGQSPRTLSGSRRSADQGPHHSAVRVPLNNGSSSRALLAYGDEMFVDGKRPGNASLFTPEGDVVLNFEDADIRQFAKAVIGDVLSANFVIDADITARITLRTNRPIAKSAVIPAVETTLAAAGLAMVRDGALYRIVPLAKAKANAVPMIMSARGSRPPGYGVAAVVLNHISASQMAKVLEPLAPENSILRVDDTRNLLMLAAVGAEMTTLLETVDMFDVDALRGMSVGFFKITNARPSEVAAELTSVVKAHAAQASIDVPQVIPIDRIGGLLVLTSRARTLELAREWIERLDKGQDETRRQLFVYHLKNRKAPEVAQVISKIFLNVANDASPRPAGVTPAEHAPDTPMAELHTPGKIRVANLAETVTTASDASVSSSFDGEGVRIVADEENNALLVRATPTDYRSIRDAIARLDVVPPLVMIEVTIAEIALKDGLQYGIEWFLKEKGSSFTFSGLDTGKILSSFPGFSYFFAAQDVAAVLNAMSEVTDVRVVSSPRIMVRDNKTATLQIGDQVPVITSTSQSVLTSDAPVIKTVQYFDTGVILKVSPQVNSGGLVTMDVKQEVSNVASEQTGGIDSPTIQQRKIDSSIAIQSGEAVVLGGLMRESRSKAGTGIPLLSKIPTIGEVFKTHDNRSERTELIVIITPRVVWGRSEARAVTDELRQRMSDVVQQAKGRDTPEFGAWHAR